MSRLGSRFLPPAPRLSVVEADAADQQAAVADRPLAELIHLLVVDHELCAAFRADDGETAVAAGLAPFEDVAVGVAIALAEVRKDVLHAETEGEGKVGDAGRMWLNHGNLDFCVNGYGSGQVRRSL